MLLATILTVLAVGGGLALFYLTASAIYDHPTGIPD
jgi:hypothetical protein